MITLKANYWGDEYSSGVYIEFIENDRVIYESSWEEMDSESLRELRLEVQAQAYALNIPIDIGSSDPTEWKLL